MGRSRKALENVTFFFRFFRSEGEGEGSTYNVSIFCLRFRFVREGKGTYLYLKVGDFYVFFSFSAEQGGGKHIVLTSSFCFPFVREGEERKTHLRWHVFCVFRIRGRSENTHVRWRFSFTFRFGYILRRFLLVFILREKYEQRQATATRVHDWGICFDDGKHIANHNSRQSDIKRYNSSCCRPQITAL